MPKLATRDVSSLECIVEKYCWDEINRSGKKRLRNIKNSNYKSGLEALESLIRQESN